MIDCIEKKRKVGMLNSSFPLEVLFPCSRWTLVHLEITYLEYLQQWSQIFNFLVLQKSLYLFYFLISNNNDFILAFNTIKKYKRYNKIIIYSTTKTQSQPKVVWTHGGHWETHEEVEEIVRRKTKAVWTQIFFF